VRNWIRRQAPRVNLIVLVSWLITLGHQSWTRGWIAWIDIPLLLAIFAWAYLGIAFEEKQ
jgi:hypothetical protein